MLVCSFDDTDPLPEHGSGCNILLIIHQHSKSSNRHGPDIFATLLFQNCPQITLILKHIRTTILSTVKWSWQFYHHLSCPREKYAFVYNYQFSIAFHYLQIFFVVMVVLLWWLTNFPSTTDKNWNDRVSGKRIFGRQSKVGNAVHDIKQATLSHLREGLLPGYFSNEKLPGFKTTEAFLLWELCTLQFMINLKYERVFQTIPFPQWSYIYSSVSGLGLQGPFPLEEIENICIYCMSSIQALNKKYGKCLPEEITQSLKNFPSIIPHLPFCFLPSSHHSSSVQGKSCQVIQWPCYYKKLLWYIGMLRNGVCMVCGKKCNLICHPFC